MSSAAPTSPPSPSFRGTTVGLLPSIVISGVFSYVIYQIVKQTTIASDPAALAISAIPAISKYNASLFAIQVG